MRGWELIIVYSSLLFGAYAEYQAEKTVMEIKKEKAQTIQAASTDSELKIHVLELSKLALHDNQNHPFRSVVVKDGKIIGVGSK